MSKPGSDKQGTLLGQWRSSTPLWTPELSSLGSVVFLTLILTDLFGSPFMRNCQVLIGLLVGTVVAAIAWYTDCSNGVCQTQRYVTRTLIKEAKWVTFLWNHPFCFHGHYLECIWDVTATTELSYLEPHGSGSPWKVVFRSGSHPCLGQHSSSSLVSQSRQLLAHQPQLEPCLPSVS